MNCPADGGSIKMAIKIRITVDERQGPIAKPGWCCVSCGALFLVSGGEEMEWDQAWGENQELFRKGADLKYS